MSKIMPCGHPLLLRYEKAARKTDEFPKKEFTPILFGLFGEVGSVISASKKWQREKNAFADYSRDVEEELGDIIWYVAALCRRLNVDFSKLFCEALDGKSTVNVSDIFRDDLYDNKFKVKVSVNGDKKSSIAIKNQSSEDLARYSILSRLSKKSVKLLEINIGTSENKAKLLLVEFIRAYIETVLAFRLSFSSVLNENIKKTHSRFIKPRPKILRSLDFDKKFPEEQQLPREFRIEMKQGFDGKVYLRWNGVIIGNSLSDDISINDNYRFHDVFHFANAAILHWSPAFRNLIKHKRRSRGNFSPTEDSNRPRLIEEGLSAYIFSYAMPLDFFKGHKKVSFGLLKTIRNFVRGYEVDKCPLYLWEKAILQGYEVFREVSKNEGGIVIGDRDARSLRYKPLKNP